MVVYSTNLDPIEIGYLGSKVKVTVTENVCQNDKKKFTKNSNLDILKSKFRHSIGNLIL